MRIAALQLRDPAHAARADRAPRRKLVKRLPRLPLLHNEAVNGVLALEDRAERAPLRERRGTVGGIGLLDFDFRICISLLPTVMLRTCIAYSRRLSFSIVNLNRSSVTCTGWYQ